MVSHHHGVPQHECASSATNFVSLLLLEREVLFVSLLLLGKTKGNLARAILFRMLLKLQCNAPCDNADPFVFPRNSKDTKMILTARSNTSHLTSVASFSHDSSAPTNGLCPQATPSLHGARHDTAWAKRVNFPGEFGGLISGNIVFFASTPGIMLTFSAVAWSALVVQVY